MKGDGNSKPPLRRGGWLRGKAWVAPLLVACALLLTLAAMALTEGRPGTNSSPVAADATTQLALPPLPPPDLVKPLTPEEALRANAERPIEAPDIEAAAQFRLAGDPASRLKAVDCLAQAIYYEAASEGEEGGRAVAQVVLNRIRHPGYPASICAAVYQGSDRATGCQFTFTCDGSLARQPVQSLWQRSMRIARESLAGRVYAPVGQSTHYHADYVVPYWAASLSKVAVIGRHIFYRFPGGAGRRASFVQRYAGVEVDPQPLPILPPIVEEGLADGAVADAAPPEPLVEADRGLSIASGGKVVAEDKTDLAADIARGELLVGEAAPSRKAAPSPARQDECPAPRAPAEALKANDLRVSRDRPPC